MLKSLYEHEKANNNIYDGVREYCITEQLNEEYFRASITKNGLGGKPAIKKMITMLFKLRIFGLGISLTQNESRGASAGNDVQNKVVLSPFINEE